MAWGDRKQRIWHVAVVFVQDPGVTPDGLIKVATRLTYREAKRIARDLRDNSGVITALVRKSDR